MSFFSLASGSDPLSHVVQHGYVINEGSFWSIPILTNHVFMQIVGAALLIWLIPKALQRRAGSDGVKRFVPKGMGNAIEGMCIALRRQVFQPNLGKYTDIFTPYLWSLFFFLLVVNILGLLPLSDWFFWVPGHWIGGTGTGNLYTTAALALITLVMIVYNGFRYHGMNYIKHFFMGPLYIAWFIAILEIFGMLFKTMALCIRLFANMLAGHIVLAVFLSFIPQKFSGVGDVGITLAVLVGCILFNFLEILVAFLHAFIFTTLTAVFLGLAVNIHHDEGHEHKQEHGHEPATAGAH